MIAAQLTDQSTRVKIVRSTIWDGNSKAWKIALPNATTMPSIVNRYPMNRDLSNILVSDFISEVNICLCLCIRPNRLSAQISYDVQPVNLLNIRRLLRSRETGAVSRHWSHVKRTKGDRRQTEMWPRAVHIKCWRRNQASWRQCHPRKRSWPLFKRLDRPKF